MNATKPQPASTATKPTVAPASGRGARLGETQAAKAAPAEAADAQDEDFEHHDTIPAPTWFDDGPESGSSSS
jgi:hypothetical protein